MEKVARFIVKARYIFAIIILGCLIASFFTINLVNIEESVAAYLPDDTNTKRALKIMDKEFTTYGAATIMLKDISLEDANKVAHDMASIEGVKGVEFDGSSVDNYKDNCALIAVTFKGEVQDEVSLKAYDEVVKSLEGYNMVIPTPLYTDFAGRLAHDVKIVLALCVVIIMIILLLTSNSYAEVLVFPIVFGVAALLNMGTNYWFGTISFVSNTVCVILQLALAIDYSIILCHRFTDEKQFTPDPKVAMTKALSKAIPEILSSCLTTVSGLIALVAMQLKLGQDLGLVLAKSILFSIVIVFLLMPTLLLWVTKLMDKSKHKSFIPKFNGWTKGVLKTRKVLPIIFLIFVVVFGLTTLKIDYSYAVDCIDTSKPTDVQIAIADRDKVFGYDNLLVVLVPKADYANEKAIIDKITTYEETGEVKSVLGISGIKIGDTYAGDKVDYIRFSKIIDKPTYMGQILYTQYMKDNHISGNIRDVKVPLIDMAIYAVNYIEESGLPVEGMEEISALLKDANDQLIGDNYTRVLIRINFPQEGDETFAFTTNLENELKDIDDGIIFAGATMSAYDLSKSFEADMFIISILTGVFVYIILLFTFKSWALPIALVAVIQGAILINFGLVPIFGKNFFFFVYLIVSAIQMGATIDYAIIVTNHYREERLTKPKDIAIYDAMNASFPAIITSGTIMVIAPLFVGIFISDPLVSSLGYCLARGSLISILSVLTVLPQLLYTFEKAFLKSTFTYKKNGKKLVFADDATYIGNEIDASMLDTSSDKSYQSKDIYIFDSETCGKSVSNSDNNEHLDTSDVDEDADLSIEERTKGVDIPLDIDKDKK